MNLMTDEKVLEDKIQHFFDEGRQVFDKARCDQTKQDRTDATRFCVFDSFIAPGELILSRIFRDMLDPQGMHGQGVSFLRLFFGELRLDEYCSLSSSVLQDFEVYCEYPTDERRRIDIVLILRKLGMSDRWIGIENKPRAGEQENQMQDYLNYLKEKDKGARICYFSGDGSDPTTIDEKDRDNHCLKVSYRKNGENPSIEHWVEQCAEKCEAEQVRWFLNDFLKYIRSNFALEDSPKIDYGRDIMNDTMVKFIRNRVESTPENLDVALCIERAMLEVRKQLIVDFTEKITEHLKKDVLGEEENKKSNVSQEHGEHWTVSNTLSDPDEHLREAWQVVLHRQKWEFTNPKDNEWWKAAGAALYLYRAKSWKICLGVAAPAKYPDPDTVFKSFEKELCGFTVGKLSKYSPGELAVPAHKVLDGYFDWADGKFLKKTMDEETAKEMAEYLAGQLRKLANDLDDIEEFTSMLERKRKLGEL